jgi:nucleoside 2-deoxyribosyltransferase
MKIYFAGSIRGGRDDQTIYDELINYIKSKDVEVLCEHVGYKDLSENGQNQDPVFIHDRDLSWIQESDAIIAEVTNPSLGVGYELGKASEWQKPVLALFRSTSGKSLSGMIRGSKALAVKDYTDISVAKKEIDIFLSSL